jgi:hypothetical protein
VSDPYRPGQYPSGPDQTTRIPPVRAQSGPPRGPLPPARGGQGQPAPANKTRLYLLRGLGLVGVAVVSGMLWWLIQQGGNSPASDNTATTGTAKPAGKYTFAKAPELPDTVRDSNCEEHSYNKVKTFFRDHKCVGLTRQLYTADINGRKTYTSVSVVQMGNAQDAQALENLTRQNDTGNVIDVLKDKGVKVTNLKSLTGGGFAAKTTGQTVIIVESDFEGGSKDPDEPVLDGVSEDALRLGDELAHAG